MCAYAHTRTSETWFVPTSLLCSLDQGSTNLPAKGQRETILLLFVGQEVKLRILLL